MATRLTFSEVKEVLILVVMEDTLRVSQQKEQESFGLVLILVVMEDTLRVLTDAV